VKPESPWRRIERLERRWLSENREPGCEWIFTADEAEPARRTRRPLSFTKRDVARAIAGHMQAGLSVQRVEIDRSGRIVIVTGQAETTIAPANEWDYVK
jgi:hypothetical protein